MKVYVVECGTYSEDRFIVGIATDEVMANIIKERSEAAENFEEHFITEYDTDNYEPLRTKSLWRVEKYIIDDGTWEAHCELSNVYDEDGINKVSCRLNPETDEPDWYTVYVYAEDQDTAIKLAEDLIAQGGTKMLVNGKVCVKLDKDEAIRLHRQMWSDMAIAEKECGKTFIAVDRSAFKRDWLKKHGYSAVEHNCFLCEYAINQENDPESLVTPFYCDHCPLDWKKLVPSEQINELTEYDSRYGTCIYHRVLRKNVASVNEIDAYDELWTVAPIEDIANLPEKEEHDES